MCANGIAGFIRFWLLCGVGLACTSVVGCQTARKPPKDATALISSLQKENRSLKQGLKAREQKVHQLEQDLSALKKELSEQREFAGELQRRSEGQQKRLEAAIVDVVRSKAKLRSLESKADAASTIAEAEIALKALKSSAESTDWVALDEIAIAEHLLKMSSQEFNAKNYGGALYLANQTKARVRTAQDRMSTRANVVQFVGEVSFSQPVPLKVIKNSNLRSGPGLEYPILVELGNETPIVGLGYKGKWVHVQAPAGKTGWIIQSLVAGR